MAFRWLSRSRARDRVGHRCVDRRRGRTRDDGARSDDTGDRCGLVAGRSALTGQEFVLAVDGIAVPVHASSTVRQLSADQLRSVYSKRMTNWRQLGGPDRPLRAVLGSARSAAGEFFVDAVLDGAPPAARVLRCGEVASEVARAASAIGIISLRSRVPRGVRSLAVSDGVVAVLPTRVDVLSEDHPLLRRYNPLGGQVMSALGRSLALYSSIRAAQSAVERAGHFAVMLRPAPTSPPIVASDACRRLINGAERLPLSLRFNHDATGSLFESLAEHDLDRVVALMR
ncbi:substrate-binding domain-containing protein [Lysobacter korlensis]|uniref:Substrate-binding domain-containing protein n=1 Tax=Lysobacter korlensis TaxID=553636 RepID=A0ABV6RT43_9GAMM